VRILALTVALLLLAAVAVEAKRPPPAPFGFQPKDAAARRAIERERVAVELINRAERHVRGTVSGCAGPKGLPPTTFTHDAPSAQALAAIGVLRRPAAPGDHVDQRFLDHLPAQDVYVDYVRRAVSASGRALFIVVARNTVVFPPQPAKCLDAAHARLLQLLAGRPEAIRSKALKEFARLRDEEARPPAPHEGVFLFTPGPGGISGGGGGGSLAEFAQRGTFISGGTTSRSRLSGAVPDGVASITFEFPKRVSHGPYYKPTIFRSAYSRTVAVLDNVVSLTVPRPGLDAIEPRMVWRAADGHVVRVVNPRS
jgi:hypothetical protein